MMIMISVTLMVHNKLLNLKSSLCHDIVINLVSSYHFVNLTVYVIICCVRMYFDHLIKDGKTCL